MPAVFIKVAASKTVVCVCVKGVICVVVSEYVRGSCS